MNALGFGLLFITLAVFVLPHEQLPHKVSTSGRLVVGALLLIAGGAGLGRAFLA